jgi:hypothetical protein
VFPERLEQVSVSFGAEALASGATEPGFIIQYRRWSAASWYGLRSVHWHGVLQYIRQPFMKMDFQQNPHQFYSDMEFS